MIYLFFFLQSNLLELPVYLARKPAGWNWKRSLLFITVLNSVTHPLVFFGFMNLPLPYLANILLAEAFAIVAEALALRRFADRRWRDALCTSAFANLISWQLAPMLTYSFFQPR
ncbi:MAG: hypothetical protein KF767_04290 [Bdellovibrionaceae bacterium]|nr:hypothetical protein [Pseudobdellovibrionaceae bacterium]